MSDRFLLGTALPAHILTPSVTSRGIVNMTALAVVEAQQKTTPRRPLTLSGSGGGRQALCRDACLTKRCAAPMLALQRGSRKPVLAR